MLQLQFVYRDHGKYNSPMVYIVIRPLVLKLRASRIQKGPKAISIYYLGVYQILFRELSTKKGKVPKSNLDNFTKGTEAQARGVPSSGYIGKTRFDLLVPYFSKSLGKKFSPEELNTFITKTVIAHDKYIFNRGVLEGTAKWKAITAYSTELLEGREPENPGWVATGRKDKWPKCLTHLRPLFHFIIDNVDNEAERITCIQARRLMITLFKLNRVCSANSTLDSLVNLRRRVKLDPELVSRFRAFAQLRLTEVRESITLTDLNFDFFLGSSNGPNLKPKLETALAEAVVLAKDDTLHRALKNLCYLTNNNDFYTFFTQCVKEHKGDTSDILLRRLASIPDKGNKSRVIAICDFWTQSMLKSVEDKLVNITHNLYSKNCCFYSHGQGWENILSQPEGLHKRLVSLDAESWTDNFPATFQHIVMKALFGQKFADSWYELAVSCPWFVKPNTPGIYFGKGQGMGTKASFAIAQLSDLLFIEFSLREFYGDNSDHYFMKVGDDLVIEDPDHKMIDRYQSIGVPINLSKSKFSTKFGNFTEFVSRNSLNNIDYSIVSPVLISKFLRNDYYGPTLYNHIKERDPLHPSFEELFTWKLDYLLSHGGKKVEEENRLKTVVRLTTVIDIISGVELIHTPSLWDDIPNERRLLFIENLILSVLGELVHKSVIQFKDRNLKISVARNKLLLDQWKLDSSSLSLIGFFLKKELNFAQATSAQTSLKIVEEANNNYQKGLETQVPDRLILTATDTFGEFHIEPETLKFIFKVQDKLSQVTNGYKTISRLSLLDKSNTKTVLNLYRYLNSCYRAEDKILDIETGRYRLPYKRKDEYIDLPFDLTHQMAKLFKFDIMLDQISNIRKGTITNLVIQPQVPKDGTQSTTSTKDLPPANVTTQ